MRRVLQPLREIKCSVEFPAEFFGRVPQSRVEGTYSPVRTPRIAERWKVTVTLPRGLTTTMLLQAAVSVSPCINA
jgi:hypothetical protein